MLLLNLHGIIKAIVMVLEKELFKSMDSLVRERRFMVDFIFGHL